ncbi:hypothetical protein M422DRAFT_243601 [Sphaerobolus stellatus SS14]|nr:hypothetical protein M422DRAFT_243601 [Sphaerobolus stellatus SS14]
MTMDATLTPHTNPENVFEIKSNATSQTEFVQFDSEDFLKDTSTAGNGELTLVLASNNGEALDKAIQGFKRYQADYNIENTKLCRQVKKPNSDHLIWADISPPGWALLVHPGEQVTLFALDPIRSKDDTTFLEGYIGISFGFKIGWATAWSNRKQVKPFGKPTIGRPKSYEEANELIRSLIDWRFKAPHFYRIRKLSSSPVQDPRFARARTMFGETTMPRYYKFAPQTVNVDCRDRYWIPFPEAAYTDEEEWRKFVPKPEGPEILGFMLQ